MVSIPKISPNLLIGVLGLGAVFLITREIRGAGQDLAKFGENFKLPDIKFPEFKLPSIFGGEPTISADPTKQTTPEQVEIFGRQITIDEQNEINRIAGQIEAGEKVTVTGFDSNADPTKFLPPAGSPQFTGKEEDRAKFEAGLIDQFGRPITPTSEPTITKPTSIIDSIKKVIAPTPKPEIVSELPEQQSFEGGGVGFIGGTIRENPIDTLSEAIALGLTASQARDFLEATEGKITPSQIESGFIDVDIRNIVGGIQGGGEIQSIPVSSTPLETLSIRESENLKAALFTCENFGLNCDLSKSLMA